MNAMKGVQVRFVLLALLASLAGCITVPAGDSARDVEKAVRDRVAAGMEYLKDEQPGDARRHFSRALQLKDDSALAHNAMALLYRYEGDSENEEHHYREALRAGSDYSTARNNFGIFLHRQGEYEKAAEQFRRAAEDPDYDSRGKAFANLGEALMAAGDNEDAKEAFKRASRLSKGSLRAQLQLARLYFQDENYRQAQRYYRRYTERTETQSAAALWLGIRIAHHLEDKDDQSSYELALKRLYPESPQYREWKQWQGRLEEPGTGNSGGNG